MSSVSTATPRASMSSCSASSKSSPGTSSTILPNIWTKRRYESNAKRSFPVCLARPLHRVVVEPQVEDGVHHPGHRERRAGAHGDEQRVDVVAEALAHVGLERAQGVGDLVDQPVGERVVRGHVGVAGLGGDREAGRAPGGRAWSSRRGSRPCRRAGTSAPGRPPGRRTRTSSRSPSRRASWSGVVQASTTNVLASLSWTPWRFRSRRFQSTQPSPRMIASGPRTWTRARVRKIGQAVVDQRAAPTGGRAVDPDQPDMAQPLPERLAGAHRHRHAVEQRRARGSPGRRAGTACAASSAPSSGRPQPASTSCRPRSPSPSRPWPCPARLRSCRCRRPSSPCRARCSPCPWRRRRCSSPCRPRSTGRRGGRVRFVSVGYWFLMIVPPSQYTTTKITTSTEKSSAIA